MLFDSFRARVGIVVINGGQILLVRDTRHSPPSFHLPGDVVKLGETLDVSAKRAVKEQAGLNVEIQKLLYVRDDISDDRHRLDLFFLSKLSDLQEPAADTQFKTDWVNMQILESMDLLPKFLKKQILKDWKNKFAVDARYIGPLE
jgi:ADP-ribose pyrophosphatase YjhB (NUDIX family)